LEIWSARESFFRNPDHQLHSQRQMQMLCTAPMQRILVVDDEPMLRSLCSTLLASWGYHVVEAQDGLDALEKLHGLSVDAVLLDMNMPRLRGDILLARLRRERPELPVIIMSSDGDTAKKRVMGLGASSFLSKPFRPAQLKDHITHALP
jgi:two-component system chemotaxis response regulator CheY